MLCLINSISGAHSFPSESFNPTGSSEQQHSTPADQNQKLINHADFGIRTDAFGFQVEALGDQNEVRILTEQSKSHTTSLDDSLDQAVVIEDGID